MAQDILRRTAVGDIVPERPVMVLNSNCSVSDALRLLEEKHIVAAPVVDLVTLDEVAPSKKMNLRGFVDMQDVATFILGLFPNISELTINALEDLEFRQRHIDTAPISDVIDVSKEYRQTEKVRVVSMTTPLSELMDMFFLGIHHVVVLNDQTMKIVNLASQFDVVAFLAENVHLLGDKVNKTVQELNLGSRHVVALPEDAPVIRVVQEINHKVISAVPLVNHNGELVCSFSASDLRSLSYKEFGQLLLPAKAWLEWQVKEQASLQLREAVKALHPLTCTLTDTLAHVLFKMVATKVHRLWLVDRSNIPLGVVSMTDLMNTFLF